MNKNSITFLISLLGIVFIAYFAINWLNLQSNTDNIYTVTDNLDTFSEENIYDQALSTAPSPVCNILTQQIADKILKTIAVQAVYNSQTSCSYTTSDGEAGSFGIITMVDTITDPTNAERSAEVAKTGIYENLTEPVNDIGADYAYYATAFEQLSIVKGAHWILITASSSAYETDRDAAIATAKLVLANIK